MKDSTMTYIYKGQLKPKDDFLYEAIGDLDELIANVNFLNSAISNEDINKQLNTILKDLNDIIKLISFYNKDVPIEFSEDKYVSLINEQDMFSGFFSPKNSIEACYANIVRTIVRRAERKVVSLIRYYDRLDLIEPQKYLNCLSKYFFYLSMRLESECE